MLSFRYADLVFILFLLVICFNRWFVTALLSGAFRFSFFIFLFSIICYLFIRSICVDSSSFYSSSFHMIPFPKGSVRVLTRALARERGCPLGRSTRCARCQDFEFDFASEPFFALRSSVFVFVRWLCVNA